MSTQTDRKPRVWHYADYGSDLNGDGSATNPFWSYDAAALWMQPGDQLCRNGVHISDTLHSLQYRQPIDWTYVAWWVLTLAGVAFVTGAIAWAAVCR